VPALALALLLLLLAPLVPALMAPLPVPAPENLRACSSEGSGDRGPLSSVPSCSTAFSGSCFKGPAGPLAGMKRPFPSAAERHSNTLPHFSPQDAKSKLGQKAATMHSRAHCSAHSYGYVLLLREFLNYLTA
jgi:hypothetical protein